MDNLKKLQDDIAKFARERDWDQYHTSKNLAMALSVEAGELLEIFQWLTEEETKSSPQSPKIKAKTKEELADVLIYLIRLADKMNIDLLEAANEKLKLNAEKYPIKLSKGNAVKYNQRNKV